LSFLGIKIKKESDTYTRGRYSEEEIDIVVRNSELSNKQLGLLLNRSHRSIERKRKFLRAKK